MNLKKIADIASYAGILGAILVSLGMPFWANAVWSFSNPVLVLHMKKLGQTSQMRMFLVFTAISWFGVWNLW